MCPRGVVGVWVLNMSSGAPLLDLRSCGGEGLGESEGGLLEGRARVADGDGHELYLAPHFPEGVDEWGVLGGLLLKPLVAPEVLAESDLEDDKDALLGKMTIPMNKHTNVSKQLKRMLDFNGRSMWRNPQTG